jgi:threonyl-tRNA synthetase
VSPVQAVVVNVSVEQEAYAQELAAEMDAWGARVELDLRREKLGYKIREAQLKKVPYMVVLGFKEAETRQVTVRKSTGENLAPMNWEEFHKYLKPLLKAENKPLGGQTH